MDSRPRRVLALLPVAALALILTLALSSGDRARAMLQASPVESPVVPVATLTLPSPSIGEPPNADFATLPPPTSVPLPETAGPTPTVRGFLPAPTIVNPNDLKSLPLAQPAVSSAGPVADPTSLPTGSAGANSTARAVVALLNYLWLLCGSALLIGGAVAIILLWRRSRQT